MTRASLAHTLRRTQGSPGGNDAEAPGLSGPESERYPRDREGRLSDAGEPRFQDLPLGRLRDLAEETAAVAAAADAGLFRALADGPAGPGELARRLDLETRPVRILLPVLAQLGLLEERDGRFALSEGARRRLADPSSPEYAAAGLPLWLRNLRALTHLPEVLRTGGPLEEPDEDAEGDDREALARFMAAMDAAPRERVRRLADLCLARRPDARRMLDLGGGPGHMSREFARRGLEVVLFDRPETVELVGPEYGLDDVPQIRLVGGDFHDDPLPEGPFDLVLLSNILHIYGETKNRALLEKVAEVTRPGGICAVAEFVRGLSPRAPRFGLIMLLRTEEGDAHREEDYLAWLSGAGFRDPEIADLDAERQLLTAVRA